MPMRRSPIWACPWNNGDNWNNRTIRPAGGVPVGGTTACRATRACGKPFRHRPFSSRLCVLRGMEAGKDTDHLMIALFLAEGFEEIEALATADVLRRSQLDVQTVGVGGRRIRGAHGIEVTADILDQEWTADELEAVVLPGGMPGTLHLEQSPVVQRAIDIAVERGLLLCAICAAPSILGHRKLLEGRRATCYPGFEKELGGVRTVEEPVVADGRFITARGAGVAVDFGLRIAAALASPEKAAAVGEAMQCR